MCMLVFFERGCPPDIVCVIVLQGLCLRFSELYELGILSYNAIAILATLLDANAIARSSQSA